MKHKVWSLVSSRVGRSVIAVVVVLLAGVGAVNLDARSPRERADAWAASHTNALPTSLAELAAYPADYQKAIRRALPPAAQSRLWREQLTYVLQHEPLNNEQQSFLEQTIAMATPESFEPNRPIPEVCPEIARLFPDEALRTKITQLGAVAVPARSVSSTLAALRTTVANAVDLHARVKGCDCRGLGICECGLLVACVDSSTCAATNDCGCIWAGPCDKICETATLFRAPAPTPTTVK
jgi:hypothetical protein